jgi:hypothetical protein
VDTQGLPHAIHITTANVTDREGAIEMIGGVRENLESVKNLLVDGGYSGKEFALVIRNMMVLVLKLQSEVNYINLLLFHNAGLLSVLLAG